MALKQALKILKEKPVLGEYGPVTRPFVVLDVEEYDLIVKEIEKASKRRIAREQTRDNITATL